ncbi:uroporphyrinogen-III C-methyltransferase [Allofranklinella schreckenbergeri]|uniref:uroporphyrinogen-III C-methyltransferase n=1 Tax=Allofranklinella schreckenbergeri TaxID=1076744 RepID=UPI000F008DFB|nr:uroporphyrinogen-III C-methyltransferase [Allofranklinella schreckenbergeri]
MEETPRHPPQPRKRAAPPPSAAALPGALARWRKPVVLPTWGAWLLSGAAALALLLAYNQGQRLNRMQEQLALQSGAIHEQSIEARTLSHEALALARDSAAKVSLSEARINEYTLQRSRIEQMAFELSRSRDETMLNDIEASLRLALQQAQLTGLADPLIAALRNASQRVERADAPRLSAIQRAIERDLQRLTHTAMTDTAGLLGRIDKLLAQLELLPLANGLPPLPMAEQPVLAQAPVVATPVASPPATAPTVEIGPTSAPRQPVAPAATAAPADANPAPSPAATQTGAPSPWWHGMRAGLGELVRVQRIDAPEAALLNREQTFFLRENIRLQLMNARMGLLARQSEAVRADLAAVQTLLQKYYDTNAPRTRQALRTLRQLQDHLQAVQSPAITETLVAIQAAHQSLPAPGAASASKGKR